MHTGNTGNFQLELKTFICLFNCWNSLDDQSFPFDPGPLSAVVAYDRGDKFSGNAAGRVLSTHAKHAGIQRSVSQLVPKIPAKKSDLLGWGSLKQKADSDENLLAILLRNFSNESKYGGSRLRRSKLSSGKFLYNKWLRWQRKMWQDGIFASAGALRSTGDLRGFPCIIRNPEKTKWTPWFQLRWRLSASSGMSGPLFWGWLTVTAQIEQLKRECQPEWLWLKEKALLSGSFCSVCCPKCADFSHLDLGNPVVTLAAHSGS